MVCRYEGPYRCRCGHRLTLSVADTSVNVANVTMSGTLVRDDDKWVYGDAGYSGMWKYQDEDEDEDEEQDVPGSRRCVAAKRGTIKKMGDSPMKVLLLKFEKARASIRAGVEHPFHVIKNLFGYRKVRYKGLARNQPQSSPCSPSAMWSWRGHRVTRRPGKTDHLSWSESDR